MTEAPQALDKLAAQHGELHRRLLPPRKGGEHRAVAEREGEPLGPRQRGSPAALVNHPLVPVVEGVCQCPAEHAVQHACDPDPHLLQLAHRVRPSEERAVLDTGVNRSQESFGDENPLRPLLALANVCVPVKKCRGKLPPGHAHSRAAQNVSVALQLVRVLEPLGESCKQEPVGHPLYAVFQNLALPLHLAPITCPALERCIHSQVLPRQHEPLRLDDVHLPFLLLLEHVLLLGLDLIVPVVERGSLEAVHDPNQHQPHNLALPLQVNDRTQPGSPRRE